MKFYDERDERRVLTMQDIERDMRQSVLVEVIGVVFIGFFFGVCGLLCAIIPIAYSGGQVSVWWLLAPVIALTAFVSLYVGYQILTLVRCCKLAFGRRYRLAVDTLGKICEGEYDRVPFFSIDTLGKRHSRYERAVTAYYFENNGRGTTSEFYLRESDFVGDTFYLVIDKKDGKILAAYNTKKYRLVNNA